MPRASCLEPPFRIFFRAVFIDLASVCIPEPAEVTTAARSICHRLLSHLADGVLPLLPVQPAIRKVSSYSIQPAVAAAECYLASLPCSALHPRLTIQERLAKQNSFIVPESLCPPRASPCLYVLVFKLRFVLFVSYRHTFFSFLSAIPLPREI